MSNPAPIHTTILAAVDYSAPSTFVVEQAVLLAQRQRPCRLHVLHVSHHGSGDAGDDEGGRLELLAWLAARLPESSEALADINIMTHETSGDPAQVIVALAAELLADHVVLGTHGRKGLERIMLGSVAETVSRHCGCSVLVVRQKMHEHPALPLEPVCGACVEARIGSQGNVLWCHDHIERRDRLQPSGRRAVSRWLYASTR